MLFWCFYTIIWRILGRPLKVEMSGFKFVAPVISSSTAQGLSTWSELPRLLPQCLREEERLHSAPQPYRPEHRRCTWEDWLFGREACLGDLVGRPSWHSGSDRHSHEAGVHAVPGLRGPAGQRWPELGLEPGRQQPAPQWRGQRQFPTV